MQGENYGASNRASAEGAALLQQEEAEPKLPPTSTLRTMLKGMSYTRKLRCTVS